MVVDPSREAVLLAERAKALTAEEGKEFVAVLNKVDAETESFLRRELSEKGIPVRGAFGFAPEIMKANLAGNPLPAVNYREQVKALLASLLAQCFC
jgi:CO dehydrogenase maturation factor